jgi:hypothetical protein
MIEAKGLWISCVGSSPAQQTRPLCGALRWEITITFTFSPLDPELIDFYADIYT